MAFATEVRPLREHWLRVTFTDGAIKEVDLSGILAAGGVFAPTYERRELFEQGQGQSRERRGRVAR
jgi:hypothetical protein